ncbi:MAG: restriction endonuclease subunit S [Bacteroidia bacterium]
MQKQKNIPQLRFPEFEGEWERKKLGEIGEFKNGINKSSEDFGFGIPFINLMDVFGKPIISNLNLGLVNANEKEIKSYELKKGDVLFIRSSVKKTGVGETSLLIEDLPNTVYSGFLIRFRDNKINLYLHFKKYCFYINQFRNDLISLSTTSANTNINQESLNELYISIPSLPEQTRIASFFTILDKKIAGLKQKKNLLEQYKKGVMQKIFSQELRFKNEIGKDFPKWEKKKLGEVAIKKSSNISANKIEDNFGNYIIYGASGVLKKVDFYKEENDYISIIKDGAGVGRLFYCKGKSSVLGTMEIIKPKEEINTHFLFSLLSNIDFVKYVSGSTIPHIYFKDYSLEICGIPCLEEQTKIASFLSAIDGKINQSGIQIEKTLHYKKSLLQNMFC